MPISEPLRAALLEGYRARASGDSGARAQAVETLVALPGNEQNGAVAMLLAELGADREAFRIASRLAMQNTPEVLLFWVRSMRGTLDDPGFPEAAKQLGLLNYWTTTHTRPDVCNEEASPPFCEMI